MIAEGGRQWNSGGGVGVGAFVEVKVQQVEELEVHHLDHYRRQAARRRRAYISFSQKVERGAPHWCLVIAGAKIGWEPFEAEPAWRREEGGLPRPRKGLDKRRRKAIRSITAITRVGVCSTLITIGKASVCIGKGWVSQLSTSSRKLTNSCLGSSSPRHRLYLLLSIKAFQVSDVDNYFWSWNRNSLVSGSLFLGFFNSTFLGCLCGLRVWWDWGGRFVTKRLVTENPLSR